MGKLTSVFRSRKNGATTERGGEAASTPKFRKGRCRINPNTGRFIHAQPHTCVPQARSSFKPRKKRREYRVKRRKMSRTHH